MKRMRTKSKLPIVRRIIRWIDLVFCAVVITLTVWIPFRKDHRAIALGILAFLGVLGIILLLAQRKRRIEEAKKRKAVQRQIRFEKLMLVPNEAMRELLNEPDLYVLRGQSIDSDSALAAIRSNANTVVCVGDLNGTDHLFRAYAPQTKLISLDELIERFRPACSSQEIDERLRPHPKKRPGIRQILKTATGNKYLLLGILLYALSFILNYQIYYRLIGSLCFGLSALTTVFKPAVKDPTQSK